MCGKIVLFLVLILLGGGGVVMAFAEDETLTITTYYPSPHGSYNELQTNKLAVGYMSHTEQPTRDGDIRFKAQDGDPKKWENGKEGQVSYSALKKALYVWDGTAWAGGEEEGRGYYYTKVGTNPVCDGTDFTATRYFASCRCCMSSCCEAGAKWSTWGSLDLPTCKYNSWGEVETCTAASWSKVLCIKTD